MRRSLILFSILCLSLVVFSSSAILRSTTKHVAPAPVQSASRCTHLLFGPKAKKGAKSEEAAIAPGYRCSRLAAGGREGSILENTPPNVGLAASTAYISANADSKVNLKAIACDPDRDTVLYTYSATGGRISGDGAAAVWDLNGVTRPATYTVTVEVDDGCGCITFDSTTVSLE
jgi:hypothetical protein